MSVRPFREAFLGYHYIAAGAVGVGYGVIVYKTEHRLIADLDATTRGDLYLSLTATTGVLLGFAITAVAIFTSLGEGAGLDLLSKEPEFPYVGKILMGAIYALAIGVIVSTALIVTDEEPTGDRWIEAIAVGVLALVLLRAWALLWILNKLLRLAIADRQRRAR